MELSEGAQKPDASVGAYLRRKFDEVRGLLRLFNAHGGSDHPPRFMSCFLLTGCQGSQLQPRGAADFRNELAVQRKAAAIVRRLLLRR